MAVEVVVAIAVAVAAVGLVLVVLALRRRVLLRPAGSIDMSLRTRFGRMCTTLIHPLATMRRSSRLVRPSAMPRRCDRCRCDTRSLASISRRMPTADATATPVPVKEAMSASPPCAAVR